MAQLPVTRPAVVRRTDAGDPLEHNRLLATRIAQQHCLGTPLSLWSTVGQRRWW